MAQQSDKATGLEMIARDASHCSLAQDRMKMTPHTQAVTGLSGAGESCLGGWTGDARLRVPGAVARDVRCDWGGTEPVYWTAIA